MTDIHEGFMWAWRTLSPASVFADGASYSTVATVKVIILMTDGTNEWISNSNSPNESLFSSAGYFNNANGSTPNSRLPPTNQNVSTDAQARAALDALTLAACTNAKAAGISVYTVGFSTPSDPIDSQGLALLRDCANSPDKAFVANDSSALIATFDQIAKASDTCASASRLQLAQRQPRQPSGGCLAQGVSVKRHRNGAA